MTEVVRRTRETDVRVEIVGDTSATNISTTIPFLDHMLVTFARYAGLGLRITATGDLPHHISEDVAIAIGAAFAAHLPASAARYGDRTIPMDDALVHCCIDTGGRPYYRGPLPSSTYEHWMRSFADNAKTTLHLRVLRGRDRHHIVEAAFKALGFSLAQALADTGSVFSTKGSVALTTKSGRRK